MGWSVRVAVFRADCTDVNALLQAQATGWGGPVNDLTVEEGAKADAANRQVLDRILNLWKMRVASSMNKSRAHTPGRQDKK